MNEQLALVGQRIGALREASDLSTQEMADKLGIGQRDYQDFEAGNNDFAYSQLQSIASILGVGVTSLLTGDEPKLQGEDVTRAGEGLIFGRKKEFTYNHLAPNFKKAKSDPFYVVKKYEQDESFGLYSTHPGEEWDYVLKGRLKIDIDGNVYELNPGDSIYYNSSTPHALKAVGGEDCAFLAIIIKE